MKISLKQCARELGSVLLVSLIIAVVAGATLLSYLALTQDQAVTIFRSQHWNRALPVAEAGVEDAMQLINKYVGSMEPEDIPKWTNTYAYDHYSSPSPGVYNIRRFLPGDTYYDVWITNKGVRPIIDAVGYVPWNFLYAAQGGVQPMFAQVETTPRLITRKVTVQTVLNPMFAVAMAAVDTIDLAGKNVNTDSFDSGDPNFSNNGQYPYGNLGKTKANGDICTDRSLINSLDVGNAHVKGIVKTGPGQDTIEIGPLGSVGDKAWVEGGNKGIQTNHAATDFNVAFDQVTLPPGVSFLPPLETQKNVTINGKNYEYAFLGSGNYYIPTIAGSVYVGTNSLVRLRIDGDVSLAGSDSIDIAAQNASLRIYMCAPTFNLGGGGAVNNLSGKAENFYYFGLPANTYISFGGNADFIGAIYAPQATFSLGGGGNETFDFIGASVTKSVQMNGHFNFHYDERLRNIGPSRGYIPVSWKES